MGTRGERGWKRECIYSSKREREGNSERGVFRELS
jgi:hypothetical protein